jgi:signal transduction histidine kinase
MSDSTAKLVKPFDETERLAGECFELIRRERFGVEIKVTDTGRGIDENFLPHIFEPFRQFSAFDADGKQKGFGLGLSIVRQIVELHGGIEVERAGCNQGATFTIQIPDNRNSETKLNSRFQR